MRDSTDAVSFGWHVSLRGNKTLGPYSVEDLSKLWERGEIGPETMCWREGFEEWLPLHRISALAAALSPKLSPLRLENVRLEAQAAPNAATSELLKALAEEEEVAPPREAAVVAPPSELVPATLVAEAAVPPPPVWSGEPEGRAPLPEPSPPLLSHRSKGARAGALLSLAISALGLAIWLWPQPEPAAVAMAVGPQMVTEPPEALSASSTPDAKMPEVAPPMKVSPPSRGKVDDDFTRVFGGSGTEGMSGAELPSEKVVSAAAKPQRRGLSEGAVAETVWAHRPEIDECVGKQRQVAPAAKGRLVVSWTVGADGKVGKVAVSPESLRDSPFAQCLKGKLSTWEFPPAGQASETVTFPFVF
jgi:hypothetical protein